MVRGLEFFARFFAGFEDRYVLIGGAACDLWLSKAEFRARATKDLDLVLVIEAVDAPFVARFWEFIREGGYARGEVEAGSHKNYRFSRPSDDGFPFMLELFSRRPDLLSGGAPGSIIPVPVETSLSRLSAILLDEEAYRFVLRARQAESGLMVLGPSALIPLKAAAFIDLREQKSRGATVDTDDIAKHRNDTLRLALLLRPDERIRLPRSFELALRELLSDVDAYKPDWQALRKSLGMAGNLDGDRLLSLIRSVYGL